MTGNFVLLCDKLGGCRLFGPFKNSLAARSWVVHAKSIGYFPHAQHEIFEAEEPTLLGFAQNL